jgi:lipoyl(octanoyl) transferase
VGIKISSEINSKMIKCNMKDRPLRIISHEGEVPYELGLARQLERVSSIIQDPLSPYELHFLEHRHVLTKGRTFESHHLVMSQDALVEKGVDILEVSRGGSVTYHGPGQLVVYVHVHLKEIGIFLTQYLRDLEQWVIDFLQSLNLDADRRDGMTGVWTSSGKICALGVAAKKFVTYHGIGLNFSVDLDCFNWIVPCGLSEPVASLNQLTTEPMTRAQVEAGLLSVLPSWLKDREKWGGDALEMA